MARNAKIIECDNFFHLDARHNWLSFYVVDTKAIKLENRLILVSSFQIVSGQYEFVILILLSSYLKFICQKMMEETKSKYKKRGKNIY